MPSQTVLIVGAGVFGLSTAKALLERGYGVTVVDRAPSLPAVDAASTDMNKVVRSSYGDLFYTNLAREAIQEWSQWKNGDNPGCYHECGVVVFGGDNGGKLYANRAYQNDVAARARVTPHYDIESLREFFPPNLLGSLKGYTIGYLNRDGGWAEASRAMEILLEKVRDLGGVVMEGSEMVGIEFLQAVENGGEGVIVRLKSGDAMTADKVIVATGSWTPSLFPEPSFGISDRLIATGQCVVMIQLTEEEARIYKQAPLILDFKTGFYIFPPNDENVVKAAIHNAGYLNLVSAPTNQSIKVSTPRTIISNPNNGTAIPKKMIEEFREILRDFYPALAEKDFAKTRMCWYSDTLDADWLIDYHPAHPSLFFATGGSGHGFKFLPNIGRLIADRFERKPGLEAPEKFTFGRFSNKVELKRSNENGLEREGQQTKILQEDELGVPDDLLGRRAS